ncbi:MAG: CBS domain-containing protein [Bacteroidota bacterium]
MDYTTTVGQIMTTEVITVTPKDTMTKVQQIFQDNAIHHLPVVDGLKIVGILSHTDYLKLLHGFTLFKTHQSEAYNDAIMRSLLVEEVMTKQVATLRPTDTVMMAASFIRENLFHALPIVKDNGTLIGIVTSNDLLNFAYREAVVI